MCRKLETEEEKVLPFGTVPPTPRTKEEEEQLEKESKVKLANVVSDYEVRVSYNVFPNVGHVFYIIFRYNFHLRT